MLINRSTVFKQMHLFWKWQNKQLKKHVLKILIVPLIAGAIQLYFFLSFHDQYLLENCKKICINTYNS